MKQFPDFPREYEPTLQKYRLRSARILAEPLKIGETTNIKSSKFLGAPYLPIGTDYPKDKDGKPLILWAQLNFSEIPHLDDYPKKWYCAVFRFGGCVVRLRRNKNTFPRAY